MPQSAELRQQIEALALRAGRRRAAVGGRIGCPALERIQASGRAGASARRWPRRPPGRRRRLRTGGFDAAALQQGMMRLQQRDRTGRVAAPALKAPAEDPELIADFVLESREHLAAIEAQALTLERDPSDTRSSELGLPRLPHHQRTRGLSGVVAHPGTRSRGGSGPGSRAQRRN